jgi:hypothetical protein
VQAFEQIFLPAVQRMAARLQPQVQQRTTVVYLATDSAHIAEHVRAAEAEGRQQLAGLRFLVPGGGGGGGGGGGPQEMPRNVWMISGGDRGWGASNALGVITDVLVLGRCRAVRAATLSLSLSPSLSHTSPHLTHTHLTCATASSVQSAPSISVVLTGWLHRTIVAGCWQAVIAHYRD